MDDIKLICFDLDDTLTHENSWEKLNVAFGITPEEDYAMYLQFKNGEISYTEWTQRLAKLYVERGIAMKTVAEQTFHSIEIMVGVEDVMADLRVKGYELALLSGSFNTLAKDVAERLGIKRYYGCAQLQFDEGGEVTGLMTHDDEEATKLQKLQVWCDELGIAITPGRLYRRWRERRGDVCRYRSRHHLPRLTNQRPSVASSCES